MARTFSCLLSLILLVGPTGRLDAITIVLDYTFDSRNRFFDTPEKRGALEAAADFFERSFTDRLEAIVPTDANQWIARFINPSGGTPTFIPNLSVPADTLTVYVSGRDLPGQQRGQGGPGWGDVQGQDGWVNTITSRGQPNASGAGATDFGPWGGSISFDTTTIDGTAREWNFRVDRDPATGQDDFYSIALHELGHVMGIGVADSWTTWVDAEHHQFTGAASTAEHGGAVELDFTISSQPHQHWEQETTSTVYYGNAVQVASMVPVSGGRREFTELDVAGLQDIGWQVAARPLMAGDANQDYVFDQSDIVQVLVAGKFLSGEPATWGQGDWNGAPAGRQGRPPRGDGLFDQLDVVAALQGGVYRTGPYAGLAHQRADVDRHTFDAILAHDPTALAARPVHPIHVPVPEPSAGMLVLFALLGFFAAGTWRSWSATILARSGSVAPASFNHPHRKRLT
jgi:hypothetical protein